MPVPWKALAISGVAVGIGGALLLAHSSTKPSVSSPRVALIGDSYAVGLGPELAKLLPGFRYEGHTGSSTSAWAAHAAACGACGDWLAAFKPDVVLVSLGVNDGASPNPANFQTLVQAIHGIGAKVVWIEPPAAVSTPSRAVIESLGVPVVPGTTIPLAIDGLHPRIYAPWAAEIARALRAIA